MDFNSLAQDFNGPQQPPIVGYGPDGRPIYGQNMASPQTAPPPQPPAPPGLPDRFRLPPNQNGQPQPPQTLGQAQTPGSMPSGYAPLQEAAAQSNGGGPPQAANASPYPTATFQNGPVTDKYGLTPGGAQFQSRTGPAGPGNSPLVPLAPPVQNDVTYQFSQVGRDAQGHLDPLDRSMSAISKSFVDPGAAAALGHQLSYLAATDPNQDVLKREGFANQKAIAKIGADTELQKEKLRMQGEKDKLNSLEKGLPEKGYQARLTKMQDQIDLIQADPQGQYPTEAAKRFAIRGIKDQMAQIQGEMAKGGGVPAPASAGGPGLTGPTPGGPQIVPGGLSAGAAANPNPNAPPAPGDLGDMARKNLADAARRAALDAPGGTDFDAILPREFLAPTVAGPHQTVTDLPGFARHIMEYARVNPQFLNDPVTKEAVVRKALEINGPGDFNKYLSPNKGFLGNMKNFAGAAFSAFADKGWGTSVPDLIGAVDRRADSPAELKWFPGQDQTPDDRARQVFQDLLEATGRAPAQGPPAAPQAQPQPPAWLSRLHD